MLLKGTNSRNSNFEHPNFGISELRTSRTLLLSPKVELNELELQKSRTVRTRTQVRSITNYSIDSLEIGKQATLVGITFRMFSVHISLYIKYCGPGPIIFEQSFAAVAEASLIRIFQQLCAEFPYYNNLPTYLVHLPIQYISKKGFFFGPVCSQAHADPHPPFWGWG